MSDAHEYDPTALLALYNETFATDAKVPFTIDRGPAYPPPPAEYVTPGRIRRRFEDFEERARELGIHDDDTVDALRRFLNRAIDAEVLRLHRACDCSPGVRLPP